MTGDVRSSVASAARTVLASKVPAVTAWFWIVKVLTTGMGEAAADDAGHRLGPPLAVAAAGLALAGALAAQFTVRRYVAVVYWTTVAMVSVFGTMVADGLRLALGLTYAADTAAFALALAAVFAAWWTSERTLSVRGIRSRRREAFYWLTVMATFALGTAVGDWTAVTLDLGWLGSAVLFALVIAVPGVARLCGLDGTAAFWSAYVLTRPLGASVADWLALPGHRGGLGWGAGHVALVATLLIAAIVAALAITRVDVEPSWGLDPHVAGAPTVGP